MDLRRVVDLVRKGEGGLKKSGGLSEERRGWT